MMQVMYETDFRLIHAYSHNRGLPDEKRYWVVYQTKAFPNEPAVFEDLNKAMDWIKQQAGSTLTQTITLSNVETPHE